MSKNRAEREDDDYDFTSDPRRKNYKKIKLEIKKAMIKDFDEDGVGIAALTKKYHLSYSTIAHILKVYKEKNRIFQSKRLKNDREQESSNMRSSENKEGNQNNEELMVKIEPQPTFYYPFFPEWAYIMH